MNISEKIDAIKAKEKNKLLEKLEAARGNYNDTGQDRYYNQIKRLEEEINIIDGMDAVTAAEVKNIKATHRKHIQAIKSRAEEFAKEEPLNIEFKQFCKWLDNYMDYIEKQLY